MTKTITLMYHGIIGDGSHIPPGREEGAGLYDVKAEKFLEQMRYLKDNDVNVTLTFDDGERNNYENVFVVLRTFGFKAYFFVTPERVGKDGYMSWDELKEMRDSGMLIGSHGLTHNMLIDLPDEELEKELAESKRIIADTLQIDVESISIPRGFCNRKVVKKAKEAGYKNIFVSEENKAGCIRRIAVRKDWDLERFKKALEGKMPIGEKAWKKCLAAAKRVLGAKIYNKVRSRILNK